MSILMLQGTACHVTSKLGHCSQDSSSTRPLATARGCVAGVLVMVLFIYIYIVFFSWLLFIYFWDAWRFPQCFHDFQDQLQSNATVTATGFRPCRQIASALKAGAVSVGLQDLFLGIHKALIVAEFCSWNLGLENMVKLWYWMRFVSLLDQSQLFVRSKVSRAQDFTTNHWTLSLRVGWGRAIVGGQEGSQHDFRNFTLVPWKSQNPMEIPWKSQGVRADLRSTVCSIPGRPRRFPKILWFGVPRRWQRRVETDGLLYYLGLITRVLPPWLLTLSGSKHKSPRVIKGHKTLGIARQSSAAQSDHHDIVNSLMQGPGISGYVALKKSLEVMGVLWWRFLPDPLGQDEWYEMIWNDLYVSLCIHKWVVQLKFYTDKVVDAWNIKPLVEFGRVKVTSTLGKWKRPVLRAFFSPLAELGSPFALTAGGESLNGQNWANIYPYSVNWDCNH